MSEPLQIADSIVCDLRAGGRGAPRDLQGGLATVLRSTGSTGADRVLAHALHEAIRRIDDAHRDGVDVSAELSALMRGLPPDLLGHGRRPSEWGRLWSLLNEHAVRLCRSSPDRGIRLLAAFGAALARSSASSSVPAAPRAPGTAPMLATHASDAGPGSAEGIGRFRRSARRHAGGER